MSLKKIAICISAISAIFLFYLFPTNNKLKVNEELEYVSDEKLSTIFNIIDDFIKNENVERLMNKYN